jgi:3-hydroxybutyryl-CoA dehydratase
MAKSVEVGSRATATKIFSAADVEAFARLTNDYNPIHFDAEYAKNTIFKKPIVHGPLSITLITTLFANELPGPGSVYLSHDVKYLAPIFVGEEIEAFVEVLSINEKKHIVLKTWCVNSENTTVIDGIARIKVLS